MAKPELNATIGTRIDLGPDLALFHVVPNGWDLQDFKAGQFAVLGLPGSHPRGAYCFPDEKHPDPHKYIQRAYSIASTPLNKRYLEFYVTLVKDGALTPRLWCLRMGDRLWLSPKITGRFTLENSDPQKNVIFICTGTGVAPFISMLKTYLRPGQDRKFVLFHGVRQSQDLAYREEFYIMENMCPNFRYYPIISRERDDPVPWHFETGRVQKLWEKRVIAQAWGEEPLPENTEIYLCGNPNMITEMIQILNKEGFKEHTKDEAGQIHTEKYW